MILCITHSSDHYNIDLFHQRVKELGYEMYRFDSDRLGLDYLFEYELHDGSPQLCLKGPSKGGSRWRPYQLPADVSDSIRKFMQSLQLSFSAIDMIRNTEGDYVFLEANPQGEWGMLQRDLNYPIAENIADKLINKIKI